MILLFSSFFGTIFMTLAFVLFGRMPSVQYYLIITRKSDLMKLHIFYITSNVNPSSLGAFPIGSKVFF